MKRAFWISTILFFVCANSLAAVLYAGVQPLDSGGGFLSLSPLADCVFWGTLMAVCALLMVILGSRAKPRLPVLPGALRFPAEYLAMVGGLSAAVLVMGMCGLQYQFSPVHLPVWGYIGLMGAAYIAWGFYSGREHGGPVWSGLAWGCALAAAQGLIGSGILHWAEGQEMAAQPGGTAVRNAVFISMGTQTLVRRGPLGWLLGRLDLPGCLLMGNYDYVQYADGGMFAGIPRETLTMLVCLIPPALFTVSWLAGRVSGLCAQKRRHGKAGGAGAASPERQA